ncbi:uncharacterized protein, partial [Pagrus major]|uniref:uncharacterized protein n=1 Tax=Pagrus major TaxID=143350 RepID=UPI003CC84023
MAANSSSRDAESAALRGLCEEERTPDAPGPEHSYVSMKNDASVELPLVSTQSADGNKEEEKPEPSCVSAKSDWSMDRPIKLKDGCHSDDQSKEEEKPEPSCVSVKSDW